MATEVLGDFTLAVEMTDSEFRIEVGGAGCIVEASVNKMLHSMLPSKLIKPNAAVDLCFLANGKAVGVDEDVLSSAESFVQVGFVICTSSRMLTPGSLDRRWASDDAALRVRTRTWYAELWLRARLLAARLAPGTRLHTFNNRDALGTSAAND